MTNEPSTYLIHLKDLEKAAVPARFFTDRYLLSLYTHALQKDLSACLRHGERVAYGVAPMDRDRAGADLKNQFTQFIDRQLSLSRHSYGFALMGYTLNELCADTAVLSPFCACGHAYLAGVIENGEFISECVVVCPRGGL